MWASASDFIMPFLLGSCFAPRNHFRHEAGGCTVTLADNSTPDRRFGSAASLGIAMSVVMPAADQAVLARREQIVADLRAIVPGEGVISAERAMRPYESDGLTAYRQLPMVVVLPETTDQVSDVLRYCRRNGIKVVPRGAGTSLSVGALPLTE